MLQHGSDLRQRDTREPLDELGDLSPVLEVLEQRCDRNSRTAEHPGSADTLRIALDLRA